jgi:hypothetical protein
VTTFATRLYRAPQPLLTATLLAALAGAAIGSALAPDGSAETVSPAPPAQPRIGMASGPARLPLPADWRPLGHRSRLPGFEQSTAVHGAHADVALDIRAPEDASLLPAAVAASDLPEPRAQRVGTRTAWRYELPGTRPFRRIVAFALPTTGGVVTFACQSYPDAVERAAGECEDAVRALRLVGASVLAPAPEAAARIVLPDTVARLNQLRRVERRRLATTLSPRDRSAAAVRLADGYDAAARRLRPLAGGEARGATALLETLARRHRALATASLRRDVAAALQAGAAIERDERQLSGLLAAVTADP